MKKEELFAPIREKYAALKTALEGTDLEKIKNLTLEQIQSMVPEEWVMRILEEDAFAALPEPFADFRIRE